jgi:DNA-binding transcriptional LysR family regulator
MLAFEQLEIFRTAVKEQSFTREAKVLFISQPALSCRIRHLEAEVGAELFDRSQRGLPLKLTQAGQTPLR